jgi:hypothetical protein
VIADESPCAEQPKTNPPAVKDHGYTSNRSLGARGAKQ